MRDKYIIEYILLMFHDIAETGKILVENYKCDTLFIIYKRQIRF